MGSFSHFIEVMDWQGLLYLLEQIAAVLLCLTVHETCHGLAAYCLGDPTAKREHRLSLNPLRHIDPLGALMMLLAGFGWAKPVPVDSRYFKHPKTGMALTALAGPVSNLAMAYISLVLRNFLILYYLNSGSAFLLQLIDFLALFVLLNVGLGVFNLIPFPPLDGSKVVEGLFPDRLYFTLMRYERWGMFVLLAVLWFGWLDGPLKAARSWMLDLLEKGASWPYFLGL